MPQSHEYRQKAAVQAVLDSDHKRKVIVAGAGAGKTSAFKKLLEQLGDGDRDNRLAVTFIRALTRDLVDDLGDLAKAYTFHAYCHLMLRRHGELRGAVLTANFAYFPKLGKLVAKDWVVLSGAPAPKFLPSLRALLDDTEARFYLGRGNYYDAIGHDDAVVRVHEAIAADESVTPTYDLVIVDEFQDFNQAEVSVIEQLAQRSNVVIAGDDDQALYGKWRGASEEHIRSFFGRADCQPFTLPFCMRCPSVIAEAVNDILVEAARLNLLGARINKEYLPFPKLAEDTLYPKIKVIRTSVQSPRANYFGRYIEQEIGRIPAEEIQQSHEKGYPTVLIIGSKPYLGQVGSYLESKGFALQVKEEQDGADELLRADGLALLTKDQRSNLGWRILVELDQPVGTEAVIRAATGSAKLIDLVAATYRNEVPAEVEAWEPVDVVEPATSPLDPKAPTIELTSFESSKGLSAQHVFVVDLQKTAKTTGFGVRKMIVALTRARKQCYLLYTTRAGAKATSPSVFIDWIAATHKQVITVDKKCW